MAGFELIKFIAMLIAIISFINFPIIYKKKREFRKYLPGLLSLILVLTLNSLSDIILSDIFSLLEIIFLLTGAISLTLALISEIKFLTTENKILYDKDKDQELNKGVE